MMEIEPNRTLTQIFGSIVFNFRPNRSIKFRSVRIRLSSLTEQFH